MELLRFQVSRLLQTVRSNEIIFPRFSGLLSGLAEYAIVQRLEMIQMGRLLLIYPDGRQRIVGLGAKRPMELRIHSEEVWTRVLLYANIGFAQSFMLGNITTPDMVSFLQLLIEDQYHLSHGSTFASAILSILSSLSTFVTPLNDPVESQLNVAAHYDVCNEMFESFLSADMTYSCPIWESAAIDDGESLEIAQVRKLRHIIRAANIQSSDHVLEIGTGWGSFAIEAVRAANCSVTTITLSKDQKATAEQRIATEGLSSKINVLFRDYRELPIPEVLYDKIVSIEMVEHVGPQFLETYFRIVDRLLNAENGIAVFQSTTIPESIYQRTSTAKGFVSEYIFPGGHLPSATHLVEAIDKGSSGRLCSDHVEYFGSHYARALRCWRESFLHKFDSNIRPALLKKFPSMTGSDIKIFRKKWEYYFLYCEAGFSTDILDNVIITTRRPPR